VFALEDKAVSVFSLDTGNSRLSESSRIQPCRDVDDRVVAAACNPHENKKLAVGITRDVIEWDMRTKSYFC
jgi:hypothetical protein